MKETRADTRNALLQATGLHVVLFALMFAGLHWNRSNIVEPARGEVIEADLIDPSALSASMQRALQRDLKALPDPVTEPNPTPPEPVPEPLPEPVVDEMPPPPLLEPDKVDQDKVQKDADAPDPAQEQREQDAKRRQQQVDLDAEREKQLAAIRKLREQATREVTMAEQKAKQLADARQQQSKAPPPGDPNGRAVVHNASYIVAIQTAIERNWIKPETIPRDVPCQVRIRQIPGGEVVDVQISDSCPYDDLGRRSLEAAVLKASPLPYASYEDVFNRDLVLKFVPMDAVDVR